MERRRGTRRPRHPRPRTDEAFERDPYWGKCRDCGRWRPVRSLLPNARVCQPACIVGPIVVIRKATQE